MAIKTKIDVNSELQLRQIDDNDIKQFNSFFSDRFEWYLNNTHLIFSEKEYPHQQSTKIHLCIGTYPDMEQYMDSLYDESIYFEHHYIKW